MAGLLQVRDVPDDIRRALKAKAAAQGESLNGYVLSLLARDAVRPTVSEVLERAAGRAERADVSVVEILGAARAERVDADAAPRPGPS